MLNTLLTDEELFYAIKSRYKIGAEQLYDRFACNVYKLTLARVQDRYIADEVTEKIFKTIWANINQCDIKNCKLNKWIMGIANTLIRQAIGGLNNVQPTAGRPNFIDPQALQPNYPASLSWKKPA